MMEEWEGEIVRERMRMQCLTRVGQVNWLHSCAFTCKEYSLSLSLSPFVSFLSFRKNEQQTGQRTFVACWTHRKKLVSMESTAVLCTKPPSLFLFISLPFFFLFEWISISLTVPKRKEKIILFNCISASLSSFCWCFEKKTTFHVWNRFLSFTCRGNFLKLLNKKLNER